MNSLVINSLLNSGGNTSMPIKTCPPKSVDKWKKEHGMGEKNENKEPSKCDVTIPEPEK